MEPFMSVRYNINITAGCLLAIVAVSGSGFVSADNYDELSIAMKALAPGA